MVVKNFFVEFSADKMKGEMDLPKDENIIFLTIS